MPATLSAVLPVGESQGDIVEESPVFLATLEQQRRERRAFGKLLKKHGIDREMLGD